MDTQTEPKEFRQPSLKQYNFGLFEENKKPATYASEILKGIIEPSKLSEAFFSRENIRIIQNMVRRDIYDRTQQKYVIDYQPETEVLLVMRSVFLTYSKNRDDKIREQIADLNEISFRKIVEKIYPNLVSYMIYLRDSSEMYKLNELPSSASIYGTGEKQLGGFDKFI